MFCCKSNEGSASPAKKSKKAPPVQNEIPVKPKDDGLKIKPVIEAVAESSEEIKERATADEFFKKDE